jgi:hypothetical protein
MLKELVVISSWQKGVSWRFLLTAFLWTISAFC